MTNPFLHFPLRPRRTVYLELHGYNGCMYRLVSPRKTRNFSVEISRPGAKGNAVLREFTQDCADGSVDSEYDDFRDLFEGHGFRRFRQGAVLPGEETAPDTDFRDGCLGSGSAARKRIDFLCSVRHTDPASDVCLDPSAAAEWPAEPCWQIPAPAASHSCPCC